MDQTDWLTHWLNCVRTNKYTSIANDVLSHLLAVLNVAPTVQSCLLHDPQWNFWMISRHTALHLPLPCILCPIDHCVCLTGGYCWHPGLMDHSISGGLPGPLGTAAPEHRQGALWGLTLRSASMDVMMLVFNPAPWQRSSELLRSAFLGADLSVWGFESVRMDLGCEKGGVRS